jgi:L-lactate dehydrogenase complex protein LldG
MSAQVSEARAAVLAAVRGALGQGGGDVHEEYARIPRGYDAAESVDAEAVLELFEDRLRDYDCVTQRCTAADVPGAISRALQAQGCARVVIPEDLPAAWLPDAFAFERDRQLDAAEIDRADGVITACSAAIALTGTIILQEGAMGQGRRVLSLLPDYHLCIVERGQIVQTVAEGLRAIEATAALATTTISGPSATADIEMTRIRGVHGPRVLEVIIVTGT